MTKWILPAFLMTIFLTLSNVVYAGCCPLKDGSLCCSGACQNQCGGNKALLGPNLTSDLACYKLPSTHNQNYDLLKVLSNSGKIVKVKLKIANSDEVLIDENPEVSENFLEPICHGTLSGRWLCTPRKYVPLYLKFKNGIVESFYIRDPLHVGVLRLVGKDENIEVKEVSCF